MVSKSLILLLILKISICPCPDADTRCLRCGGDRCLNCIGSFSNSSGICVAIKSKIENCLEYTNENQCLRCQYGFKVNELGKC